MAKKPAKAGSMKAPSMMTSGGANAGVPKVPSKGASAKPGNNGKASMINGPFGGKSPQGKPKGK